MLNRPLLAAATAAALLVAMSGSGPAHAVLQDTPEAKPAAKATKPLSKSEMKKFKKALGMWLLFGDDEKTAKSDKRAKYMEDLKQFDGRTLKGVRQAWNGWVSGKFKPRKSGKTELAYKHDPAVFTKNEIVFAKPKGYRGKPVPLVVALHGGGRGVGSGGQAMGGYGQPFAGKGCVVFAPTVPGHYVFAQPPSEQFIRRFIHEVMREYSIDFDRVYCVGHSLGGVGAWAMPARMPDFWAGSVSGAGNPPGIIDYSYLYNTPIWVHHSTTDTQVVPTWNQQAEKDIAATVPKPKDIQFHWYVAGDARGHGIPADHHPKYQAWLMKQKRNMYPERVIAVCPLCRNKDDHGNLDYPGTETSTYNFWVGIRGGSGAAKVDASVKGNTITATAGGCAQVVFYLADELVDMDKPVKIVLNGSEVHNKVVPRSVEYLAKHIEETDDRGRFFSAEVVLPVQ